MADTTHMETSEKKEIIKIKRSVRSVAIVCAIMVAMIWVVYWLEQTTKSQSCKCKCFDAGYLQACEDLENYLLEDQKQGTVRIRRSRED
jgi:CHASE3 domain sensor protein